MRSLKLWPGRKHRLQLSEAELNKVRNIERIFNRPKPMFKDRWWSLVSATDDFWCRYVSQRKLYRMFDSARHQLEERGKQPKRTDPEYGLDRLRRNLVTELNTLGVRPFQDRDQSPRSSPDSLARAGAGSMDPCDEKVKQPRSARRTQMQAWWMLQATDGGNPQDDSNSGNKHGGGGSDEGGNTNDGQGPADG